MENTYRLPEDFGNKLLEDLGNVELISLIKRLNPKISEEHLKTSEGKLISRYGLIQRVIKENHANWYNKED